MFAFSAETLASIFNPKNISAFRALGGLSGLEKGLATDCHAGLNEAWSSRGELYAERRATFGENRIPEKKQKSLLGLMLIALDDKVLIILSVTSVISLALGLYQTFGLPHAPGQPRVEWVDSVTILTAVAIAVVLGALNDYQKERQFAKLNRKVKDIVPCLDHTLTVIDREMIALSKQSDLESL
jgi:Ca2+-transporting ATPase